MFLWLQVKPFDLREFSKIIILLRLNQNLSAVEGSLPSDVYPKAFWLVKFAYVPPTYIYKKSGLKVAEFFLQITRLIELAGATKRWRNSTTNSR